MADGIMMLQSKMAELEADNARLRVHIAAVEEANTQLCESLERVERQRDEALAHLSQASRELGRMDVENELLREALRQIRSKGVIAGMSVMMRSFDWEQRMCEALDIVDKSLQEPEA